MDEQLSAESIFDYFSRVPDPRVARTRKHPLTSVLVLSLLAIICGADSFVAIEMYGQCQMEFLKSFLDLPNGIPSHDTIGRIFAAVLAPSSIHYIMRPLDNRGEATEYGWGGDLEVQDLYVTKN